MSLTVHGVAQSRAARVLWMCRELGLDFEHDPLHFTDPRLKAEDYLAINPNGRIPSITDGDVHLWESMAINLYLAKKHGSDLYPKTLEGEAQAWQWSLWVMTEVEKLVLEVLLRRMEFPEGSREKEYFAVRFPKDPAIEQAKIDELARPFGALERSLAGRQYLLGDEFSVVDLNVAAVLAWVRGARIDMSAWPAVDAWLNRCLARPAYAGKA